MLNLLTRLFSRSCPYCRSVEFRGVGVRNFMEETFFWLLHPYRCDFCGHHFFLFRWMAPVAGTA